MAIRLLFLICLSLSSVLVGGIEEYFKPVTGVSPANSMKNIDFIAMINLDERPEKFAKSSAELAEYGIYPYRFSAVNGWKIPLTTLDQLGVVYTKNMPKDLWGTSYLLGSDGEMNHEVMHVIGKNYFSHCLSRGAIGIVMSHASLLQYAHDCGHETVWFMEDDTQIIRDPRLLSTLIEKLDKRVGAKNWDILFTDPDTKNQKGEYVPCTGFARRPNFTPYKPERFAVTKIIDKDFRKIGARFGAYSMIIRRSGIEKLLTFLKKNKVFLPYDMEFYLPQDIQLYTTRYDVVSTMPQALSDNGAPRYLNK